jgi:Fe-S cluster biogenesis protein NfuA
MLKEQVELAIGEIRPQLQADGGDIELVDVKDDGTVSVRLTGACGGCPMALLTLKQGVEVFLKEKIPQVKEVVRV